MESSIGIDINAPAGLVFGLARDVERWPNLLPHYVRATPRVRLPDGSIVVDFIARRPLVPIIGLGLPVAWRSRCWSETDPFRLRFVHVAGATAGMDVTWRIEPSGDGCRVTIEHRFRRTLPIPLLGEWLGPDAFPAVVDRFFVRPIASRTLASFRAIAEAIDRRGGVGTSAAGRRDVLMTMTSSARRRVWITGLGLVTPIGLGRDAFWRGVRAGRSPVRRIDRFDPGRSGRRSRPRSTTSEPTDFMTAKTARQLDRFSQFGLATGRMALEDAGLSPGRDGAPGSDRIGIYLGSALGGIAYAEEQHERYMARGIRAVAPNLALAVFGGAAPANLGIALEVHGPILSTANSCASGAVALGEALAAIRAGEIDAAVAGGVEVPLSPLAFGAFDIIRALSAGHNDRPDQAARPFDAERDGFVMGEGRRAARARGGRSGRAARRDPVRRGDRLRRQLGRVPHGPASARWPRGGPRRCARPRRRGAVAGRRRLRQRPCLVDADRRRRRGAGHRRWPWASAPPRSR